MRPAVKLAPTDPLYPPRLADHDEPPELTVSGPLDLGRRAVAIVGSRSPSHGARAFAYDLARALARAGAVIVSGGAVGIDRAAHEGALDVGGATWLVACTGRGHAFPGANRDLFQRIESSSASRMIWPFPDSQRKTETTPRSRNAVLVLLAHCVVVIQAALRSGSRNAIGWAREHGRPLFLVPGAPWDSAFDGTKHELLRGGATPLWDARPVFGALGLPADTVEEETSSSAVPGRVPRPHRRVRRAFSEPSLFPVDERAWSPEEKSVFSALSIIPKQRDEIIARTGLGASSTVTALLTLTMKDVVVEGPDGFFRRRNAH